MLNLVIHVYYYNLSTYSGSIPTAIGMVLFLLSLYNYFLISGRQQTKRWCINVWKICCWFETMVLLGTAFAEGILILLYSDVLYFDVPFWCSVVFYVCSITDILGHLFFLSLAVCCDKVLQKRRNTSVDLDDVNNSSLTVFADKNIKEKRQNSRAGETFPANGK